MVDYNFHYNYDVSDFYLRERCPEKVMQYLVIHPCGNLAKFCHKLYFGVMSTMNISLPDSLRSYVDKQVAERGYGTSSEYVRDLIRKDQDRMRMRALLLEGAGSATGGPAGKAYFQGLRGRISRNTAK